MIKELKLELLKGECWWGGLIDDGVAMPFGGFNHQRDLNIYNGSNRSVPLLISSKGRYIWCEKPFDFKFDEGQLVVRSVYGDVECGEGKGNLKETYSFVSRTYFPAAGRCPDLMLFKAPQYNLWIELLYNPTQEKVLEYAHKVLEMGMAPGVLMIDDNWQEYYGSWDFHPGRFPDPKAMNDELHALGFKVMVWVCPFVSPDTLIYRQLRDKGFLLKDRDGEIAIRKWWNGYSSVIDCTNPQAVEWYHAQMDRLAKEYGVDGFKLDAGDLDFYREDDICYAPAPRNGHCEAWAKVGLRYPLNEYRACWKMAGQPLVQRLRDKNHSWDNNGLDTLIPNALAQGLAGYQFVCPDMIGGGEYINFTENSDKLDQELFVRYAQCSALFPMMQFSAAPWRVLDQEHLNYCIEAAKLHQKLGEEIAELAEAAALSGEPIMRHMAYEFPDAGYETIKDKFMLGSGILVAPVIIKGAVSRVVAFPSGTWIGDDSSEVEGPCYLEVETPLSRLPWYRRV